MFAGVRETFLLQTVIKVPMCGLSEAQRSAMKDDAPKPSVRRLDKVSWAKENLPVSISSAQFQSCLHSLLSILPPCFSNARQHYFDLYDGTPLSELSKSSGNTYPS